jgi:hypothetical protein
VLQHRVTHLQEHPGRHHPGDPPTPPLRYPVISPGDGRVVPEVDEGRLNQRPTEPAAPLPGDATVPCDFSAALLAGHQTLEAAEALFGGEAAHLADLDLQEEGRVVANSGNRHQKPDVLVVLRHQLELPAEPSDLLLQRRHQP